MARPWPDGCYDDKANDQVPVWVRCKGGQEAPPGRYLWYGDNSKLCMIYWERPHVIYLEGPKEGLVFHFEEDYYE